VTVLRSEVDSVFKYAVYVRLEVRSLHLVSMMLVVLLERDFTSRSFDNLCYGNCVTQLANEPFPIYVLSKSEAE
jgi:hypothetical protein